MERSYVVHIPDGHASKGALPVVLAFHGATMNGPMMASFSGLNETADQSGFFVVYPNGTGPRSSLYWNGGNCCGWANQHNIDDVAFIDALLDDLVGAYTIDQRRVYATGISNGGVMVYRLAAELSHRIAAIAPVAGSVGTDNVAPRRPVSVLHFHGTEDAFIPFAGGKGSKSSSGVHHRSVQQSIQIWVKVNGCHETPLQDILSQPGDELKVSRSSYRPGQDGAEVVLIAIEGGGHTWPGQKAPARILGQSALNISANDLMWAFFQRHPLR
jgi:polyhydroxybutyrate depolymerase